MKCSERKVSTSGSAFYLLYLHGEGAHQHHGQLIWMRVWFGYQRVWWSKKNWCLYSVRQSSMQFHMHYLTLSQHFSKICNVVDSISQIQDCQAERLIGLPQTKLPIVTGPGLQTSCPSTGCPRVPLPCPQYRLRPNQWHNILKTT